MFATSQRQTMKFRRSDTDLLKADKDRADKLRTRIRNRRNAIKSAQVKRNFDIEKALGKLFRVHAEKSQPLKRKIGLFLRDECELDDDLKLLLEDYLDAVEHLEPVPIRPEARAAHTG